MAYFIIPVQFGRKRSLSPTDKAEYASNHGARLPVPRSLHRTPTSLPPD